MDRTDVLENDPTYKQFVVYCVVHDAKRVLSYKRSSKSGEKRLVGNRSIGFGGHVNLEDSIDFNRESLSLEASAENAVLRELQEELGLEFFDHRTSFVGTLYDESTAVNRVHLGLVYHSYITYPDEIRQSDNSTEKFEWIPFEDVSLRAGSGELELWSVKAAKMLRLC